MENIRECFKSHMLDLGSALIITVEEVIVAFLMIYSKEFWTNTWKVTIKKKRNLY